MSCGFFHFFFFLNLQGGLKNAIKADVIQTLTMIFVTIVIIIQGFYRGGGVEKSIKTTRDAGELFTDIITMQLFNFTFSILFFNLLV